MVQDNNEQCCDPWWAAELSCWTMVVLAPILTWVNGPAVSTDQAVVRAVVFTMALAGGITIRIGTFVRRRRGIVRRCRAGDAFVEIKRQEG